MKILILLVLYYTFSIANEVNIYSHRHYEVDKQIYKEFEKKTGIKVNVMKASSAELIQRIEKESKYTKADILLTTDIGMISLAESKGIFQSVQSEILNKIVPKYLKEEKNLWFALTKRARVIAYNTDSVEKGEIKTYEDLENSKWLDRIVVTKSTEVYNQSLLASMIAHKGSDEAKKWATNVKKNMARKPSGVDKDSLRAISAGFGDVAIVNTYYLGQMAEGKSFSDKATAEYIAIVFPNQETTGTHINISGAGVVKYSKNKENAVKLLEYLVSKEVQEKYASVNFEYPVNPAANLSPLLKSWGTFKEDKSSLEKIAKHNTEAVKIFQSVGWDR